MKLKIVLFSLISGSLLASQGNDQMQQQRALVGQTFISDLSILTVFRHKPHWQHSSMPQTAVALCANKPHTANSLAEGLWAAAATVPKTHGPMEDIYSEDFTLLAREIMEAERKATQPAHDTTTSLK